MHELAICSSAPGNRLPLVSCLSVCLIGCDSSSGHICIYNMYKICIYENENEVKLLDTRGAAVCWTASWSTARSSCGLSKTLTSIIELFLRWHELCVRDIIIIFTLTRTMKAYRVTKTCRIWSLNFCSFLFCLQKCFIRSKKFYKK